MTAESKSLIRTKNLENLTDGNISKAVCVNNCC